MIRNLLTFIFVAIIFSLVSVAFKKDDPTPPPPTFLRLVVGNSNASPQGTQRQIIFTLINSTSAGNDGVLVDLQEPFQATVFNELTNTELFSFTQDNKVAGFQMFGTYRVNFQPQPGFYYNFKVYLRKGLPTEISSPVVRIFFYNGL